MKRLTPLGVSAMTSLSDSSSSAQEFQDGAHVKYEIVELRVSAELAIDLGRDGQFCRIRNVARKVDDRA